VQLGLCVPSQHWVRPPLHPHTPLWCEQQPLVSGESGATIPERAFAGDEVGKAKATTNVIETTIVIALRPTEVDCEYMLWTLL
jgi:hypothetical protein